MLESPKEVRQAQVIVTFLDVEITTHGEEAKTGKSLVNSGEILTDDLTRASAEISAAELQLKAVPRRMLSAKRFASGKASKERDSCGSLSSKMRPPASFP